MKKKWNLLTALLLTAAMMTAMIPGAAAAGQNVDPENDRGSITVTAKHGSTAVQNIQVTLYRVGEGRIENSNLYFDVVKPLEPGVGETAVELNGLDGTQNKEAAAKLQKKLSGMSKDLFVDATKVGQPVDPEDPGGEKVTFDPDSQVRGWTALTGEDGAARFEDLPVGVYLVVQSARSSKYYNFTPVLVYLPMTNEDGTGWDYDMEVDPKLERRPSKPVPEEPTEIIDPEVPTVEPPEPPVEPEPEPPVEIEDPDTPKAELPQTGMLQWPVPLLAMAGLALFTLGWMKEQKARKSDGSR